MLQDLRVAFRTLRKSPGFTAATVLTLALGIGANSAMFSIVNGVLLKPLPYPNSDQLTLIWSISAGGQRNFVATPDLVDLRAQAKSFSGFLAAAPQSINLTGGEQPDRVRGDFVSANYFDLLGGHVAMGRTFAAGEDQQGELVAVITDRVWRSKFASDPQMIGRKVQFNGDPYIVIGVLGADYIDQPFDADVFLPLYKYPNYTLDRARASAEVIARLKPGAMIRDAQAELTTITAQLAAAYPDTNRGRTALVVPLKDVVVGDTLRSRVNALAGAVGFVLLIACANVAGLFAARMVARERERAIRLALGATRRQLISSVMAEALVLAMASGAIGLGLAWAVITAGASVIADQVSVGTHVTLDPAVVGFTCGIALLAALLVAAIPAWQTSGGAMLREGVRAGAGAIRNRSRTVLAAAEIAMAMVLLIGAGLTIKSLEELGHTLVGFDTGNLLTFEYRVPKSKYQTDAAQIEFHRRVTEEIRRIPGVVAASSVRASPLGGNGESDDFLLLDRPAPAANEIPQGQYNAADPYFFETMRIPLVRGRVFNEHDTANSTRVVVINQTLARKYFANADPIGKSLRIKPADNMVAEIVGVVGDIKQFTPEDQPEPQIYGVLAQNPFVFNSMAVRAAGDPATLQQEIRKAVWRVDQDQPMWKMRTTDAQIAMLAQPRELMTSLLGSYAGLALLLASIGIFGVISYSVSQRTAEIGIRMALGATPGDVGRIVLKQSAMVIGIGVAVGLGAAAGLSRFMQSQLFGVSALDPMVYATVAMALGAVALAACWIPARKAMRVDPMIALRHE